MNCWVLKVPAQGWYELQSAQNQNKVLQGFVEGKVKHTWWREGQEEGEQEVGRLGLFQEGVPWESGGRKWTVRWGG